MLSGLLWFTSYRHGPSMVRRPLFWVLWVVAMAPVLVAGTVLLAQGSVSDEEAVGVVVGFATMMVLTFVMAPSRGGAGGGCGGRSAGGGDSSGG
ncbi:hypothetical protein AB0L88_18055 [Saccharopolyspora shandongensis]|uniref:hypothetical protein n=1 Tax=Saccharopolyspora shandongensis TaxID=418495 RepID=UPI003413889B